MFSVPNVYEQFVEGHSRESMKAWVLEHGDVGTWVIFHDAFGGIADFHFAKITGVNQKNGRIYLESPTAPVGAHYKSGQNCYHPKGQKWLLEPTPERVKVALLGKTMWQFVCRREDSFALGKPFDFSGCRQEVIAQTVRIYGVNPDEMPWPVFGWLPDVAKDSTA